MEVSAREKDVVAVAKHYILEMSKHEGFPFVIHPDMVASWLGTIVLLKARIDGRVPTWVDGPEEYCRHLIKESQKALEADREWEPLVG
jgi:hypothetical protein